jgi:hypothetical protein
MDLCKYKFTLYYIHLPFLLVTITNKKFEDTKEKSRSRKLKDKQYNAQKNRTIIYTTLK